MSLRREGASPIRAGWGTWRPPIQGKPLNRLALALMLMVLLLFSVAMEATSVRAGLGSPSDATAIYSGVVEDTGFRDAPGQLSPRKKMGAVIGRQDGPGSPHIGQGGSWGDPVQWGIKGALALFLAALAGLVVGRRNSLNAINSPGFEVISPTEKRRFFPLDDRFQTMEFINKIETRGNLRISANINKVSLSIRRFGYLMEDKNFRNALLVNRRRVRRTLLRDGDVLDLGDLTLLYRDNRQAKIVRYSSVTPGEGKSQIKFERLKGPVRKGMPMLVSGQSPHRTFYIAKNLIFIGRSEKNDLTIKSRAVHYRHAKIERVGGQYKFQDLSLLGNTFVNNRRVEQRFLKEGDEISIENHRFKFRFATRSMRERPPQPDPEIEESDPSIPEEMMDAAGDENGEDSSFSAG